MAIINEQRIEAFGVSLDEGVGSSWNYRYELELLEAGELFFDKILVSCKIMQSFFII